MRNASVHFDNCGPESWGTESAAIPARREEIDGFEPIRTLKGCKRLAQASVQVTPSFFASRGDSQVLGRIAPAQSNPTPGIPTVRMVSWVRMTQTRFVTSGVFFMFRLKNRIVVPALLIALSALPIRGETAPSNRLDAYPEIEPFETGYLRVSDVHEIYYELSGRRDGTPVFVLHGGPGGGSYPGLRRYHDPSKWLIVLHDQRGAGKSKPYADLRDNNTPALVEDIEKLRRHLKLDKVHLFGGSWGSTLAVAHAEAYPDRVSSLVLRGVFLGAKSEIDHFYHGGVEPYFPEVFARLPAILPAPEKLDYPRQLLAILQGDDPERRKSASLGWAGYEIRISRVGKTDAYLDEVFKDWDPFDFSLIENHYMAAGCFLEEGQLLRNAGKMASIPTVIVQGRYDLICPPITAYKLHKVLPKSRLIMVEDAGHSGGEPGIRSALIEATRSLE